MGFLLFIPFLIQTLCIVLDEYYFHLKRGLPLWERIGHPLDTLSVLSCLLFVSIIPFSLLALKKYIFLSILSCLMVTKDEWIHKDHCAPEEQWLHALLFINHPIVLSCVALLWWAINGNEVPNWMKSQPYWSPILIGQTVLIGIFFLYQVIYWNFIWKKQKIKSL